MMAKKGGRNKKGLQPKRADESVFSSCLFSWHLSKFDVHHEEWGIKALEKSDIDKLMGKLKSFESMKWKEFRKNHAIGHYLSKGELSPKAKKRWQEIQIKEANEGDGVEGDIGRKGFYSMRFEGRIRLIGELDEENCIFQIIWYDPNHQVCLSEKKHT